LRSDPEDVFFKMYLINDTIQGRTQREVGFKKPLIINTTAKANDTTDILQTFR